MTKHMLEWAAADGRGFVAEVWKLWKQHSFCKMDFAVRFMLVLPFLSCSPPSSGTRLKECRVRMRLKNKVFSKSVKPQVDRSKQMWNRKLAEAPSDSLASSDWCIGIFRNPKEMKMHARMFWYNEKMLLQVSAL